MIIAGFDVIQPCKGNKVQLLSHFFGGTILVFYAVFSTSSGFKLPNSAACRPHGNITNSLYISHTFTAIRTPISVSCSSLPRFSSAVRLVHVAATVFSCVHRSDSDLCSQPVGGKILTAFTLVYFLHSVASSPPDEKSLSRFHQELILVSLRSHSSCSIFCDR